MINNKISVGIDIGGTNTAFGIVDKNKNILYKNSIPTDAAGGPESFISRLRSALSEKINGQFSKYILEGIGVAAPGANNVTGSLESAANIRWGKINIAAALSEIFNVPASIINDANAAALGEKYFGIAKGMKHFVVLTIGTGLGSGIVANGHIVYGENGFAGEFGHVIMKPGGRLCGCGRRGCLEAYVSASGVCKTAFELLSESSEKSELRNTSVGNITTEKLYGLAAAGDVIAKKAFEETGKILGLAISNITVTLDPEAVILAGGVMKSGNMLMDPVKKSFNETYLKLSENKTKIMVSKFTEGEGAFLGASCLLDESMQKQM
jgi:glucokinase